MDRLGLPVSKCPTSLVINLCLQMSGPMDIPIASLAAGIPQLYIPSGTLSAGATYMLILQGALAADPTQVTSALPWNSLRVDNLFRQLYPALGPDLVHTIIVEFFHLPLASSNILHSQIQ